MNTNAITIAVALLAAAVPSVSSAEPAPKAGVGMAVASNRFNQIKVQEVFPGGTADRMGLRPGDVITHAGGKRINSDSKLSSFMRNLKVGDPVEFTVRRGSEILQLKGKAMERRW